MNFPSTLYVPSEAICNGCSELWTTETLDANIIAMNEANPDDTISRAEAIDEMMFFVSADGDKAIYEYVGGLRVTVQASEIV
jgi:hypothetical protein